MKILLLKFSVWLSLSLMLFLFACTNTTEPIEEINKIEYLPKQAEAETLAESMILQSFRVAFAPFAQSDLNSPKSFSENITYYYLNGWHTWMGEIDQIIYDKQTHFRANYLAKIQFQDETYTPVMLPEDAKQMKLQLNSQSSTNHINQNITFDETLYDFEGETEPINDFPRTLNAKSQFKHKSIGSINNQKTEVIYEVYLQTNNLQIIYNIIENNFYYNGSMKITMNGIKIMASFNNSRTAFFEVFQGGKLLGKRTYEMPDFYKHINLDSFPEIDFGPQYITPLKLDYFYDAQ